MTNKKAFLEFLLSEIKGRHAYTRALNVRLPSSRITGLWIKPMTSAARSMVYQSPDADRLLFVLQYAHQPVMFISNDLALPIHVREPGSKAAAEWQQPRRFMNYYELAMADTMILPREAFDAELINQIGDLRS